jgi:hypothetical protein
MPDNNLSTNDRIPDPYLEKGEETMPKSLIHPNRCKNGCSLFEPVESEQWNDIIGYCGVHGGKTAISNEKYIFLQVRGCCSYGGGG